MFQKIVCTALLAVFVIDCVNSESLKIRKCPESTSDCEITRFDITPCREASTKRACKIKREQAASLQFDFVPTFSATEVKVAAYWVKDGEDLDWPGMNTNGCDYMTCPIVANQNNTYHYSIVTDRGTPIDNFTVKWKLTNEEGKLCCLLSRIRIEA